MAIRLPNSDKTILTAEYRERKIYILLNNFLTRSINNRDTHIPGGYCRSNSFLIKCKLTTGKGKQKRFSATKVIQAMRYSLSL